RAEHEQANAERRREEAEASVYFSRVAQARLERELNHPDSALRLLELCRPSAESAADRRGWEWYYLQGILHSELLTIPAAHESFVSEMVFDPATGHLATAGGSPFGNAPHADYVRIWQTWGAKAGQRVLEFPHPRMV